LRLFEVIPFSKSLEIGSSYEVAVERRYTDSRCIAGGMVPATTGLSYNAEYDPDSATVIPSHTATSHHDALQDESLAKQRSLKRGMIGRKS
jgi:hypothetical protein